MAERDTSRAEKGDVGAAPDVAARRNRTGTDPAGYSEPHGCASDSERHVKATPWMLCLELARQFVR
jgi:hypothetical protein